MKLRTIGLISILALGLLAVPLPAKAQEPAKVPRIGFLSLTTEPMPQLRAFRQGLRDLGYVEGRSLVIEYRSADRRLDRLPALAAELVALDVDVIVTYATPGVRAAMGATRTIPIVVAAIGDAVERGFVDSLARPSGNVTGLSFLGDALAVKRVELLREIVPNVSRLGLLFHAMHPKGAVRTVGMAARSVGLEVQPHPVRGPKDFEQAFAEMADRRTDALTVLSSPIMFAHRKKIVVLAARNRIPAAYGFWEFARDGGLMSYAPSLAHLFHRAATYVDKILKGAKPAELPLEQPTKFELLINLKTAKALGLTIPPEVLFRADKVIK